MAELAPYPFDRLVTRMFAELDQRRAIFDLPERKFMLGPANRDLSVRFHGKVASTPLGPAAGPQSQLAQNIVLSFLGGGRIFELKTVQIQDRLTIARPCIDMRTVGYNVEWSQELTLEQSLEEYVKAAMLIEMLVASGKLSIAPESARVIFDMSVGYDLAGIRSERVGAFMRGLMDAGAVVEKLRRQIPDAHADLRVLPFPTRLSSTLTLSTFHGCPPDEIERITSYLLEEVGLDCVVKLNPTLLGKEETRRVLNDVLGYADRVPDSAFEADARYEQAVQFVDRLDLRAKRLGRSLGIKLTNTLVVENPGDFLPKSEALRYLSGPPLHALAMDLVRRFRATFGDRIPISFSGGIDRTNFADAVSLGLVPVTVCSDLLRTNGYARMQTYFENLGRRMNEVGARAIGEWVLLGQGQAAHALDQLEGQAGARVAACRQALEARADLAAAAGPELFARWLGAAKLLNTERYVEGLLADPRYARAANTKSPPKRGTHLVLFDCLTCDKCIPVCPNDANFTYVLPRIEIPIVKLRSLGRDGWAHEVAGLLRFEKKHQLANFADFCNDCGNCDVFCPEDGGPYLAKPRFFGSREHWAAAKKLDGFFVDRRGEAIDGRFGGKEYHLRTDGACVVFHGEGFDLSFSESDPESTVSGTAEAEVDLTYFHILNWLRKAVAGDAVNYVNA
jgi:putative selenate reductase